MGSMDGKIRKKMDSFFLKFPQLKLQKGETIIEGDRDLSKAFYLKNGYVRAYTFSPQGVEITLHVFAPGSYFPMMDTLAEIENRYYYDALTPVELYSAPKEKVLKFLKQEPEVVLDLARRLLLGLDKLLMRLEYLAYGSAHARVTSSLLFLARHFSKEKNQEAQIQYLFTHKDIASFAGISRETASREVEKLVKKGLISYKKHLIKIKDINLLKKQAIL